MNELLTFRGRRQHLFGRRAMMAFFLIPFWALLPMMLLLPRLISSDAALAWLLGTLGAWFLGCILVAVFHRWIQGPHAAIELSRHPRRARCWWKAAITGQEKERIYDIPDDSCVVYRKLWDDGESGNGAAMHSVWIEGVPRDFDIFQFAVFSRGRKDGDPCALAANVADFLGLQVMKEGSDRPWMPPHRKKRGKRLASNRRR